MEYGLIPNIDQFAKNSEILSQQIQPSSEISKIKQGDEAKEIAKEKFLENRDIEETSKTTSESVAQYQEVVLTNLNFGFNNQSKDFYVKAIRGEAENQYPTDEMMRLKAFFLAEAKEEAAKAV